MAQIHFGVVYDTETGTLRECAMDEMPTGPEHVWDDAAEEWRKATDDERELSFKIGIDLARLLAGA